MDESSLLGGWTNPGGGAGQRLGRRAESARGAGAADPLDARGTRCASRRRCHGRPAAGAGQPRQVCGPGVDQLPRGPNPERTALPAQAWSTPLPAPIVKGIRRAREARQRRVRPAVVRIEVPMAKVPSRRF